MNIIRPLARPPSLSGAALELVVGSFLLVGDFPVFTLEEDPLLVLRSLVFTPIAAPIRREHGIRVVP